MRVQQAGREPLDCTLTDVTAANGYWRSSSALGPRSVQRRIDRNLAAHPAREPLIQSQ
jgi:hypothetical protein